ncbi:type III pantothenate kinase [Helcococcus massiliensis]|uniref:type III pantothenate kinase n=1 Tax=Helcococcus massiliensis TaxID=2040290 RepID=UPI000CDEBEB3|nr:type III pantothenate kinase [Helcococcus massiliensis]
MILLIDIGNTNVVLGIYENDKKINSWRLETRQTKTLDEYGLQLKSLLDHENIDMEQIEDIVIGSVVPNLENTFKNMCKKYFNKEAIVIGENTKTGMPIKYENPKEVGADRIANSVAMAHGYKLPAILIDMGTAITFDVVSEKGEYLGGVIAPGVVIASNSLFEKASKLPKVEFEKPKNVVGKNTVDAIKSGMFTGYVGLVDNIIDSILKELDYKANETTIISTGGYSKIIADESKYITSTDEDITLQGMNLIYKRTIESNKK